MDRTSSTGCLGLTEDQVVRLRQHGIHTIEDFYGIASIHDEPARIANLLHVDTGKVEGWRDRAGQVVPDLLHAVAGPQEEYLGCLIDKDETSLAQYDLPEEEIALPNAVSLIDRMSPIRDQGRRGTCVAHAFVAIAEYLWTVHKEYAVHSESWRENDPTLDLSEQFHYWACKQEDGHPGPGTYMYVGGAVLSSYGVCAEWVWPYNPHPIPDNEGQDPPPPSAREAALRYRCGAAIDLQGQATGSELIMRLKACMAGASLSARPAAIALPLYESFFNPAVRRTGRVVLPLPGERLIGWHAMAIAGYQDDESAPGGGYFRVRNSWSTGWAYANVDGAGYCHVPYEYVARYARGAHTMLRSAELQVRSTGGTSLLQPRRRRRQPALHPVGLELGRVSRRLLPGGYQMALLLAAALTPLLPNEQRGAVGMALVGVAGFLSLPAQYSAWARRAVVDTAHKAQRSAMVLVRQTSLAQALGAGQYTVPLLDLLAALVLLGAFWPQAANRVPSLLTLLLIAAACADGSHRERLALGIAGLAFSFAHVVLGGYFIWVIFGLLTAGSLAAAHGPADDHAVSTSGLKWKKIAHRGETHVSPSSCEA